MPWIESHTVLLRHRKLIGLSRELKIRRAYALGHLHALWHAAMEQQEDGDLSLWSDEMISESSDFPGEASVWVQGLQKHGFLDGRVLHDWIDYAGRFLIKKYGGGDNAAGREKLTEIWKKHGREYGQANKKRVVSDHKANLPNQPDLTNQPDQPDKPEEAQALFVLPTWIDSATWSEYLEVRKAKRAAQTPHALGLIVADLKKFRDQGQDVKEILENSVKSGWAGVFPLRDGARKPASGCPPVPGKYSGIGDKA